MEICSCSRGFITSFWALLFLLLVAGCAGAESQPAATRAAESQEEAASTATVQAALPTHVVPRVVTLPPDVTLEASFVGSATPEPPVHYVTETAHFVFQAEEGYPQRHAELLSREVEEILDYVSRRRDGRLDEQITITLRQRADIACPARGMYVGIPGERQIVVYSTEDSDMNELRGILAHEIAHTFGSAGHLVHIEALATWGAGEYWTAWKGANSLDDLVRAYIEAGDYLPLHKHQELTSVMPDQPGADCLKRRDILYTEWAAFLDYLMQSYGEEALQTLTQPPIQQGNEQEVILEPPDYEGVYGMSLQELEAAWLAMLDGET